MSPMFHELFPPRPSPPLVDRELTLIEMLDDPIVLRLMRRDGVRRPEILELFEGRKWSWLCRAA